MRNLLKLQFLALLFPLFAQVSAQNFAHGHYIAADSSRRDGLVAFQMGQDYFLYRENKDAEPVKLRPADVLSFDWGAQTMLVRNDLFVRQIVGGEAARLYLHSKPVKYAGYKDVIGEVRPGQEFFAQTYLVDRPGDASSVVVETKKKKFVPQMTAFFSDVPELAARIEGGEFEFGDIERLVRLYNDDYAKGSN